MRLAARDGGDALHEIKNAFGWAPLFGQHGVDHFGRLALAEAPLAKEVGPVLVAARHYLLTGGADAVDEGGGRALGEPGQCRRRLAREAAGGELRVADGDLLEILHTPEIAVLAHARRKNDAMPSVLAPTSLFQP